MRNKNWIIVTIAIIATMFLAAGFKRIIVKDIEIDNSKGSKTIDETLGVAYCNDIYYDTLQDAIDASKENDRIILLQDTVEMIVINQKVITIEGNNHSIIASQTVNQKAIMQINEGTVKITDLTIDGNNLLDDSYFNTGIYAINVQLYLDGVKIININHLSYNYDKYPNGTSLHIYMDDLATTTVLQNLEISNFHKTAIYLNNSYDKEATITINNVIITGVDETDKINQQGIVIMGQVGGVINYNRFKNISSSGGSQSCALTINKNNPNLRYDNNTFENVQVEVIHDIIN